MNKIFTRVIGGALGLAMAIGVGVGLSNRTIIKTEAANDPTATLTISTYATSQSWETGSKHVNVPIDSHSEITLTGGNNTGNYYTKSPAGIRMYQTESPTLTISVDSGYQLSKVSVSYNQKSDGCLVNNETVRASGAEISTSGTSLVYTVSSTAQGTTNAQVAISVVKVWYSADVVTKPLRSNPVLSTGSSASIPIGSTLSLGVTTDPADTDEAITVTSADPTKVSVTGDSSPYTLTGLAVTDSPINVVVAGAKGVYKSTVAVSVTNVPKNAKDKVLTASVLGLTGGSYADNNGTHAFESVDYVTNQVNMNQGMQFQKNTGYIYNSTSLFDVNNVASKIKAITIVMDESNVNDMNKYGVPTVYEGTSANPSSVVSVSGTFAPQGINKYVFSGNSAYFKIAEKDDNAAMHIDYIIIELLDNTTTALGAARGGASTILTKLNGLCGTGGSFNVSDEKWAEINSALEALSDDAKALLKNTTRVAIDAMNIGSATIECAMYHYDACVTNLGKTPLSDVTDKTAPSSNVLVPLSTSHMVNYSTLIIVISSISLVALGGFLVIRRKKEQ